MIHEPPWSGPNHPGNRHFQVTSLALPVLLAAAKIVDTLYTKISSDLSDLDTNSLAVEQAGFGEYISVCACFSVKLTTVLFFGMTLVGFAVPVATVALVFLAVRSKCLSLLASRPEFLTPWLDHLMDLAK
jgi:Mn2+/Fe2+ NRAMP family transporter|tara:strand:+ start:679 stop:1068 length:390 start_codon:yes stop_codon:yes gene_type:complete